jgi:hypothetical protein
MRWTLLVRETNAPTSGRRRRVVLMPRRWHHTCGNDSASNGDNKARSPGRARRKPLKPFAREKPECFGGPVVTNSCAFYTAREAAGAQSIRLFLRPLFSRDMLHAQLGQHLPREGGCVSVCLVIPGWSDGPDPESRDSGFYASHSPGMTSSLFDN